MKERTAKELEELYRVEAIRKIEQADTSVCTQRFEYADSKGYRD